MERETGFEPATPSLEGWRSTAELFPRRADPARSTRSFTPVRTSATRWWGGEDLNLRRRAPADLQSAPFGHLGTSPFEPWTPVGLAPPAGGRRWFEVPGQPGLLTGAGGRELNPRPTAYKAVALPLSYASKRKTSPYVRTALRVKPISSGGRRGSSGRRRCRTHLVQRAAPAAATFSDPTRPAHGDRAPGCRRSGPPAAGAPAPRSPAPGQSGPRRSAAQGASASASSARLRRSRTPLSSGARAPGPGSSPGPPARTRAPPPPPARVAVRPAAWCFGTMTPWTPSASAVRSRLPRFRGSWTWSRARNKAGSPRSPGTASRSSSSAYSPRGHPGHHPLVMAAPRHGGQRRPRRPAERTPACRASARMSACRSRPSASTSDLLDRGGPGSGAPRAPGRGRPGSGRGRRSALPLPLRSRSGVSSSATPSASSSARSASARAQSRRRRASCRCRRPALSMSSALPRARRSALGGIPSPPSSRPSTLPRSISTPTPATKSCPLRPPARTRSRSSARRRRELDSGRRSPAGC